MKTGDKQIQEMIIEERKKDKKGDILEGVLGFFMVLVLCGVYFGVFFRLTKKYSPIPAQEARMKSAMEGNDHFRKTEKEYKQFKERKDRERQYLRKQEYLRKRYENENK